MAGGFFNRDSVPAKMSISLRRLGLRGEQTLRNLWLQKDLMKTSDRFETESTPRRRPREVHAGEQPCTSD